MDLLVNVDVDDLSKAITFYQRAIGLQVGRRFGSFAVEMLGASSAIYLLLKPDGTRSSAGTDDLRRYCRHWTPVHLDFVVPEIGAAASRAIDAGAAGRCERWRDPSASVPLQGFLKPASTIRVQPVVALLSPRSVGRQPIRRHPDTRTGYRKT
jgi:catechol 2,3-dioxygenase-like lactoylglutathione lyase family enzyme